MRQDRESTVWWLLEQRWTAGRYNDPITIIHVSQIDSREDLLFTTAAHLPISISQLGRARIHLLHYQLNFTTQTFRTPCQVLARPRDLYWTFKIRPAVGVRGRCLLGALAQFLHDRDTMREVMGTYTSNRLQWKPRWRLKLSAQVLIKWLHNDVDIPRGTPYGPTAKIYM